MARCGGLPSGSGPMDMSDAARKRIAIVAALEREVSPLVKRWRVSGREHEGRRFRFFENDDTVLVCGGVGFQAARRAAGAAIILFQPQIVYSVGFAGALDSGLKVGDIVRPARIINANDGSRIAVEGGEGVLISFSAVASPEQKRKLRD